MFHKSGHCVISIVENKSSINCTCITIEQPGKEWELDNNETRVMFH